MEEAFKMGCSAIYNISPTPPWNLIPQLINRDKLKIEDEDKNKQQKNIDTNSQEYPAINSIIEVSIENSFISIDTEQTSLILRLINNSPKTIKDVIIEYSIDNSVVDFVKESIRRIKNLEPSNPKLLNIGLNLNRSVSYELKEIVLSVSLQFTPESAKDLKSKPFKLRIPIKSFYDVIPKGQIIKFFQGGAIS